MRRSKRNYLSAVANIKFPFPSFELPTQNVFDAKFIESKKEFN